MANIVLFHSVLGVREGVLDAQERLTALGHNVHICDQYEGRVFDDYSLAHEFAISVGYPELYRRALLAVEFLQPGFIALGFSNGAGMSQLIATRHRLAGIICCSGLVPLELIEADHWPAHTAVQIHYTQSDPYKSPWLEQGLREIRTAGSRIEYYEYPGNGHLFTDPSLPLEYQPTESDRLWHRVEKFIACITEC